jgi:hypothetical protein
MRRDLAGTLIVLSLAIPLAARAEEQAPEAPLPRLGMDPGEPQQPSAPPSLPFGISPAESKAYVLDFHGYLQMPLRVGVLRRKNRLPGQTRTALHTPPMIPQDRRSFEYTGAIPDPWVQLNFIYGNSVVSGTAILAGTSASDASGIFNPVEQIGVQDAFVTVNLAKPLKTPIKVDVGAVSGRYGAMGVWDAGRYGTPLIARTNTVGERITAAVKLGSSATVVLEQGIGGQIARPPRGVVPAGWNDYVDPNVGASFVNQIHGGMALGKVAQFGLHYMTAWCQDDQGNAGLVPNGRITVFGADGHLTAGPAGHLFLGAARTLAHSAQSVGGVIEVLNARGGPELISRYLGPNSHGSGSLTTVGAQYDLSVAKMLYGDKYLGKSSDVLMSIFGIGTRVQSSDKTRENDTGPKLYDGVTKIKVGGELTYSMLSWFAVSGRFDHVRLNGSDNQQAINILSPRLLFHTGWLSRDEFVLQYSHFTNGKKIFPRTGSPPVVDPSVNPDQDVIVLSAVFWW